MIKISKRPVVILILVVALMAIGGFYFINKNQSTPIPGSDNNTLAEDGTQFSGPTEEELNSVDKTKEKLASEDTETPTNSVQPVITSANVNEVRSFVPGIVEDGGTCTATFTKDSISFTKSSKGFGNVSNTNCEPISVSASDFSSQGSWSVVIVYDSPNARGSSQSRTIEVK